MEDSVTKEKAIQAHYNACPFFNHKSGICNDQAGFFQCDRNCKYILEFIEDINRE